MPNRPWKYVVVSINGEKPKAGVVDANLGPCLDGFMPQLAPDDSTLKLTTNDNCLTIYGYAGGGKWHLVDAFAALDGLKSGQHELLAELPRRYRAAEIFRALPKDSAIEVTLRCD